MSLEDQHLFCITLSSYIKSGLSITEVLRLLQRQTRNKLLRPIYTELRESVEGGRSLAASMRVAGVFRESLVGMVESGERSASLPDILEKAAELIHNEVHLRRKLRSSLTYPLLMFVVGMAVVVFLLTFVVPRLTALVIDSGAELPFVTRLLIFISDAVTMGFIPLLIALLIVFIFLRRSGRSITIPIFREIKENIAFSMIFSQTGTLLKSGLPLIQALKLTEPLDPVKGRLQIVQDHIRKGYRFSQGLEKEGSFPEEIVSVVRVSENGRDLPDGLIRLGSNCWDIAQSSMQKYATLAEPLIILVMGFLVGFVVIAVLLPIFDLSTLATR
ncbi:MAG: type II secretion system F family protein [Synergistaceae bacterium]|nr:type II secretion system F family protein [Synergistaceae bacterium]MBP9559596.1 type II secretion system F family protein [Synergistaceae bacterium]MBP9975348.1 type II secretion system F family protein [Synergistaceae bacterium]